MLQLSLAQRKAIRKRRKERSSVERGKEEREGEKERGKTTEINQEVELEGTASS